MNSQTVAIDPEDSITLAARLLKQYNIGSVPVVSQEGSLRGILTDRDIVIRCVAGDTSPDEMKVKEAMTRGVISVSPEDDIKMASDIMADDQVRRLPVVRDGRLIGMLSLADIARRNTCSMEAASALSDISEDRRSKKR
jgi:CBS domain-containing protein